MRQSILLFVIFISASLGGGCSGKSDVGSQTNIQNANSSSVAGQSNAGTSAAPRSGRPVLQFVPIQEDSQIAQATQDGKLYEVRIWKKHPKLLKVESTTMDEKNKALSIILRTAQVVNITTDRIPDVKLATADQFLALVPESAKTATKTEPKKAE